MRNSLQSINVLFTASGRRVELIRAFRQAYATAGITGSIVCVDVSPLAPTLYEADASYIVPPSEHPEYIPTLVKICRQESIHLVFPLIDSDVERLARHRALLEAEGTRVVVVQPQTAEIISDKWLTYQFFKNHNIPAPPSWLPEALPPEPRDYPLFVKPRRGSASKDTYKVSDESELKCSLLRVRAPIIQKYLDGLEITTDVFCDFEGNVLGAVSRLRLETRAGEISKGKTVYFPQILQSCVRIAHLLGVVGPMNVQGFIVGDTVYFTEINARFGGGTPLSIAAGANAPLWYLQLAAGLPINPPPLGTYIRELYMTRYDQTLFLSEAEYASMASRHL